MSERWVYRNNAHPDPDGNGTTTFGRRQPRLDGLANWELVSSPESAGTDPGIMRDRLVMPAAWADAPLPPDAPAGAAQPDPVGAQLVVVTRTPRRSRAGSPPATIKGTPLDPGSSRR